MPARTPGTGTYFVTSVTSGRRRLFQVAGNAELLMETLQVYRHQGHYKLHAFVIMPDHITFCLPLKAWPSSVPWDLSKAAFRGG
jgi:putative transposase